jgi:hypothetical protein
MGAAIAASSVPMDDQPRPVTRSMRALLYVLTALTFFAGTQLFVLSEHTDAFFSWSIDPPMTAAWIGAGFWSAAIVSFWAARQRLWVRARLPVPTILIVATLLLVATLDHIDAFHGLLGAAWIEVYAVFAPIAVAIVAMQLVTPGRDPGRSERVPASLRVVFAVHAVVFVGVGLLLFASPGAGRSIWPWDLTDLTAEAVGTWLAGIGVIAGYIAVRDDREDLPGNALAYLVLGGGSLLAVVRFAGDLDFGRPGAAVFVAFAISVLAAGAWSALLCLREGRYRRVLPEGGIPVELAAAQSEPAADVAANGTRAPAHR